MIRRLSYLYCGLQVVDDDDDVVLIERSKYDDDDVLIERSEYDDDVLIESMMMMTY